MLAQLVAEATARRWLVSLGVPAWRNPAPPTEGGRYSLILRSGLRIAVSPLRACRWSFDAMAAAKCSFLIVVDLDEEGRGGVPAGYLELADLMAQADPDREVDAAGMRLRPAGGIRNALPAERRPRLSFVLGTLRLLLLGEPEAPPPEKRSRFPQREAVG